METDVNIKQTILHHLNTLLACNRREYAQMRLKKAPLTCRGILCLDAAHTEIKEFKEYIERTIPDA